jgi:hypothetical protein
MAVIWREDLRIGWVASPLKRPDYSLHDLGTADEPIAHFPPSRQLEVRLIRVADQDDQWVLLCPSGAEVRINGAPLSLGMTEAAAGFSPANAWLR